MPKKPLTPLEQLRNLCNALSEDALVDNKPLTNQERAEAEQLRTKLVQFVENYEARLYSEDPEKRWAKKAAKKNGSPGSGYVM
jgi:hypothetical protein